MKLPDGTHRRYLAQWLVLGVALAILGAYGGYVLLDERQRIDSGERARLVARATIVEKNLGRQLQAINSALEGVRSELPFWRLNGWSLAARRLSALSEAMTGVRSIQILDASGAVLASSEPGEVQPMLVEREYFEAVRVRPDVETLYLGPPSHAGQGGHSMSLARMVPAVNGAFDGVVAAMLDPDEFEILLDSIRDTSDTSTRLVHGDGRVFFAVPERSSVSNVDLAAVGSLFSRHRASGQHSSVESGVDFLSGERRLVGFSTIQPATLHMDNPLLVGVARNPERIFATWRQRVYEQVGAFVVLVLASGLGLAAYQQRRRARGRVAARHATERRQARAALKKSEARYRTLVENMDDMMTRVDKQGRFTFVNRSAQSYLGLAPEACIGRSAFEFVHPDDRDATRDAFKAWLASEDSLFKFENRQCSVDGTIHAMQWRIAADRDAAGEIIGFSGTARDVTAERRAEAALQESERNLGNAQQLAQLGAFTFDIATGSFTGTAILDGILGLEPGGGRNIRGWIRCVHRADRADLRAYLKYQLEHGLSLARELRIVRARDGAVRWVHGRGEVDYGADGRPQRVRGTLQDITERKQSEERIRFLAYHDVLTSLPNRMLARDRLQQALAQADRSGEKVALIFIDLDNFKVINDSLGHVVGDQLLKMVAERLVACVRDTDTVSREGGDEFLIILPALLDADASTQVLTNVIDRLKVPCCIGDHELTTSASVGVAMYPDDGQDFDALLKKADTAMYRAKDAGRNTYRFFDEHMNTDAIENLQLRNGLGRAIERGELALHYQPQINLLSGELVGVEALLRWRHPEFGMVSPAKFIPIAEMSGLIVPIGEWVMFEACRQTAAWHRSGLPRFGVAVNLSAVQFKRGDIENTVIYALEQSGLDPALLELELTESILIGDTERVLASARRLKQMGVKLSIDDFGTGYSSLSYLKRFEVDKLKIDQSFVRDLASDADDAAIVAAIVQMARSLGLKTIAEGVEDERTLHRLRAYSCDEAQGYYFARPMPADELARYCAERPSSAP